MDLQPCFVLHHRPYTDSKYILSFLTRDHGLMRGVARVGKKTPIEQKFPLFQNSLISCYGRSELKSVKSFELQGSFRHLQGTNLYCGLYLNEIMERLLNDCGEFGQIYGAYEWSINCLSSVEIVEPILRQFEFKLIDAIGCSISFLYDAENGEEITEHGFYRLDAERGFIAVQSSNRSKPESFIPGKVLLAIASSSFDSIETLRWAKYLSREIFKPLLGTKPLKSRELFVGL